MKKLKSFKKDADSKKWYEKESDYGCAGDVFFASLQRASLRILPPRIIAVGDSLHTISFERLNKDPPLFIAKDIVVAPGKDIANLSISACLSESRVLKSLIVTVVSGQAFVASGELEWLFPAGEQLNMYGKTVAKPNKDWSDGIYRITFLSGLNDLYSYSSSTGDRNVLLKMYSKKGRGQRNSRYLRHFLLFCKTRRSNKPRLIFTGYRPLCDSGRAAAFWKKS